MTKKTKRLLVYGKFDGRCAYCGDSIEYRQMQIDHIIPKANFLLYLNDNDKRPEFLKHLKETDQNHIDNLFPACGPCNKRKDTMCIETFRTEIQLQLERTKKYSANYRMALKYNQVIETPKPIIFYFEKIK